MNPIPATITHISDKGVQVTGHRLPKPRLSNYIEEDAPDKINDELEQEYFDDFAEYEASRFTAWVENVIKLHRQGYKYLIYSFYVDLTGNIDDLIELKRLMSCQVIEAGDGKVKIVKLVNNE